MIYNLTKKVLTEIGSMIGLSGYYVFGLLIYPCYFCLIHKSFTQARLTPSFRVLDKLFIPFLKRNFINL